MQQLDQGGAPVGGFGDAAAKQLGGKENKHGAHLLAFTPHDIAHDFIQQQHPGLHRGPEFLFKLGHFGRNRGLDIF
jgi:hypothetical protein